MKSNMGKRTKALVGETKKKVKKVKNTLIGALVLNFLILLIIAYGILDSSTIGWKKYSDAKQKNYEKQKILIDLEFRINEDILRYKTLLLNPNDYNKTEYIRLLKDSLKKNIKVLEDNNLTQFGKFHNKLN